MTATDPSVMAAVIVAVAMVTVAAAGTDMAAATVATDIAES